MTSFVAEPHLGDGAAPLSAAERALVDARPAGQERAGAYAHLFRTRPDLVSYALEDSPLGLAALIAHFWHEWSERPPGTDELLTTITLYWATGTIASSLAVYGDWQLGALQPSGWDGRPGVPSGVDSRPLGPGERIQVPVGIALFSLARCPREWAERSYADLRRFTLMPRGGHFGAAEEPELLAGELRTLFRGLRA